MFLALTFFAVAQLICHLLISNGASQARYFNTLKSFKNFSQDHVSGIKVSA